MILRISSSLRSQGWVVGGDGWRAVVIFELFP
ncbi:MAG: hypothetical protein BWX87_02438 [Bacteroidetes bacterium ADurb.Bin123]|nr:MAG: hypothetical protein BWX87_02438 [Bacteroidetes bacterium ADurb.Bin123]